MEMLKGMSAWQRSLLISGLPILGLFLFAVNNLSILQSDSFLVAMVLAVSGLLISIISSERGADTSDTERLKKALEVCQANVMVADNNFNICYMNDSVNQMMRNNEARLKSIIPTFDSTSLVGSNIDQFHKKPEHQRGMIAGLTQVYTTDLVLNDMTFGLVATPLFSNDGDRIGTVVEWYDKTEELKKQIEEQKIASDNARIAQALKICDTNVMMADENMNIIYMNDSVSSMMSDAESEIKNVLPNFNASQIIGKNIDVFHKAPSHQRNLISNLNKMYKADIKVGKLTFGLIATPVLSDDGVRLGTVVEWVNKTDSLRISQEQERISEENLRVRQALDNVTTNAMIADGDGNIVYLNNAVKSMLQNAEKDIQTDLPDFNAAKTLGSNFDSFHKNPVHQRNLLASLKSTYKTQIAVGGRTFSLVANPVVDGVGNKIGTVVEWADRTHEVRTEQEIDSLVTAASSGNLSVRLKEEDKNGFMLKLGKGLNTLMDVTEEVINDTIRVFDALAHGNLQEKISRDYQGSFGKLKEDANTTVDKLIETIGGIMEAANAVSTGADEIAQGNADLSQRTEEQASSLEETASSMEEMTSVVKQSTENARQADTLSSEAKSKAEAGGAVVHRAVKAMSEINQSSKKISDIIGVIDEIAFQTNLLALNAAVEAARAGEQGRGFAVVAGEVRNLAQRSAGAAKEIKGLIRDSVSKVEDGSNLVNESGETLQLIVDSVQQVSKMIKDIATASIEQTSGIEQVNTAVSQMDEMTQQNAALVEEASAAGESLSDQARQLMDLIGFFTIENLSSGRSIASLKSTAPELTHEIRSPVTASSNRSKERFEGSDEWQDF
jgi:methyl-accepting chemotaxis protein